MASEPHTTPEKPLLTVEDVSVVFDVESTDHISDMIASHQYDLGFVFGSPRHAGLPARRPNGIGCTFPYVLRP